MVLCKECKVKWATFGPIGGSSKNAEYCKRHKPAFGYVNVVSKRCKLCDIQPNFGPIGGSKKDAEYCKDHKPPGYVDVKNKRCKLCDTRPTFGPIGGSKNDAEYCKDHKPALGYEDVCNKRCKLCDIIPTFGPIGGSRKDTKYCKDHKPPGYVDVVHKRCKLCDIQPTFGPIGGSKKDAEYCKEHKPPGYVDVKNKRCKLCDIIPTFGPIGGSKKDAEYCADHKPPGYVDVCSKRCKLCDTIPSFGPIGGSKKDAEYCADHKPPGYDNVCNKRCQYPDCKKRPTYGYLSRTTSFCAKHKKPSMIQNPIKRCHECRKIATYTRNKHYYCDTCNNNALDSIELGNICVCCCNTSIADNPDKDVIYCSGCIEKLKSGEIQLPVSKRIKEKENRIAILLKENNYIVIRDSIIEDGCGSLLRPDFRIKTIWGNLLIEIDEKQHRYNDPQCEIIRMKQLFQALQMEKLYIIRYNPDNYMTLPNQKPVSKSERETTLLKYIKELTEADVTEIPLGMTVLYLYYNYFDPAQKFIIHPDPYDEHEILNPPK